MTVVPFRPRRTKVDEEAIQRCNLSIADFSVFAVRAVREDAAAARWLEVRLYETRLLVDYKFGASATPERGQSDGNQQ